jgi:hypothetical protein
MGHGVFFIITALSPYTLLFPLHVLQYFLILNNRSQIIQNDLECKKLAEPSKLPAFFSSKNFKMTPPLIHRHALNLTKWVPGIK